MNKEETGETLGPGKDPWGGRQEEDPVKTVSEASVDTKVALVSKKKIPERIPRRWLWSPDK